MVGPRAENLIEAIRLQELARYRAIQSQIIEWSKHPKLLASQLNPDIKRLSPQEKLKLIENKYKEAKAAEAEHGRLKEAKQEDQALTQARLYASRASEIKALYGETGVPQQLTLSISQLEKPAVQIPPAAAQKRTGIKMEPVPAPTAKKDAMNGIKLYSEYIPVPEAKQFTAELEQFCNDCIRRCEQEDIHLIDPKLITYPPDQIVSTIVTNFLAFKQISSLPPLSAEQAKSATPLQEQLPKIRKQVATLWRVANVKATLHSTYSGLLEKDRANEGAVPEWEKLQRQKHELTSVLHRQLKDRFLLQKRRDAKDQLIELGPYFNTEINILTRALESVEHKIDLLYQRGNMSDDDFETHSKSLTEQCADQAAILAYQKIRMQKEQMLDPNIGVTIPKSREKLLNTLIELMARNEWPLMVGETGCGKTSFVKIIAHILTGRDHIQIVGGRDVQLREYIATQQINPERSFYNFGPVGVALSGFMNSIDWENDQKNNRGLLNGNNPFGRILFIDEGNEFSDQFLQRLLKPLEGKTQGMSISYPAEIPPYINLLRTYGTGIIMAINPPGQRYGRKEFRQTEYRLFEGGRVDIPYLPMDWSTETREVYEDKCRRARTVLKDEDASEKAKNDAKEQLKQQPLNDELYQFLLANMMDNYGEMRVNPTELMPFYNESHGGDIVKQYTLADKTDKRHGVLLRFALAVGEMHKNFDGKPNVNCDKSYSEATETQQQEKFLRRKILDLGTLRKWMEEYQDKVIRDNISLDYFIRKKLYHYYTGITSDADKNEKQIIYDIFKEFHFEIDQPVAEKPEDDEANRTFSTAIVSRTEIGYMLPSTPRHTELEGDPVKPDTILTYINNQPVRYRNDQSVDIDRQTIHPGGSFTYRDQKVIFLGLTTISGGRVAVIQVGGKKTLLPLAI